MSRSNPTSQVKNPSTKWMEWAGGKDGGFVTYYDKETKSNVKAVEPFGFIVLDELSTVKGWHDASESGISANEVRDTKAEPFVVKAVKGGVLAEGIYAQIRDRIAAHGGKFVSNIYIAYKEGQELKLGSLQFSGAALNAWVEFKKANRDGIYSKAVKIVGAVEGKKGSVIFKTPKFALVDITPETNAAATKLDAELLQPYLVAYLKKPTVEKVAEHAHDNGLPSDDEIAADLAKQDKGNGDTSVPF